MQTVDGTLDVFDSELGWFGVVHQGNRILRIKFGFATESKAKKTFSDYRATATDSGPKAWRALLQGYAEGKRLDFETLELDLGWTTPFQSRVLNACQAIPYGQTASYKELAANVGSPGAARAVGTVMKINRFPIVIPCHRVLSSQGLGGYSAGTGTTTKTRLLEMERLGSSPLFSG